ncbi:sigma-54 dependent transcriptional regulator [Aromatoleum toluclasticum]|uniref:sigma-54-dependent transcriptional regulator n=1 Tax=Aromatoleum toluclasticum TaxID=92003 RepID=UPI001D1983A5|nr:sigma-54 dependent transcriptional regulator [Aromatoleum toluclasticum]MCC4117224.1 sigma-54 dependent transcriptional regulator [Aromatoleum toluclasticum]
MKGHVLIVDDESLYRQLLTSRLGRAGYRLSEAADGEAALECAQHGGVDLALVDIKMPGIDGIEVLKRLKQFDPQIEVVILTGHGNVDSAISAMKLGAFDYLSKPYKLTELDIVVERALEKRQLARRCAALSAEVAMLRGSDDTAVIGRSAAWQRTLELVRKAAPLDLPVLITGESGAGKEIVAGLLHRWSQRAAEAYVPLNCGLLDDDLVESELFGHKRGAFSGATADKEGLFEVASAGTLFLDEIGELPGACQAKLLRVLDSGEFRQLGATALRRTGARVVAATHRDLDALVADGKFRHDLLYRLNVVHIPVPPLRERVEDIPLLVDHLTRRCARTAAPPQLTPAALARLCAYRWPGNVRELRNAIERLVAFGDRHSIDEDSVCAMLRLPLENPAPQPSPERAFTGIVPLEQVERDYVTWVLEQLGGNVSAAAQALGVSRSTVYRVLRSTAAAN